MTAVVHKCECCKEEFKCVGPHPKNISLCLCPYQYPIQVGHARYLAVWCDMTCMIDEESDDDEALVWEEDFH